VKRKPHEYQRRQLELVDRRVAQVFAGPLGLKLFPPPLKLPKGTIGQVWHEQQHSDPGQRWLRGVIADVAKTL